MCAAQAQAGSLPEVNEAQKLKLKQLTVVSLAIISKAIAYEELMQQLDVSVGKECGHSCGSYCPYPPSGHHQQGH